MQFRSLIVTGIVMLASTSSAWAHHSHGNYMTSEWTSLEGTVTELRWINPHSWFYLEVLDAEGEPVVWALEANSLNQLRRAGWTQDALEVGDKIFVRCHALRDRSNGCLLGFVTTEDGVELSGGRGVEQPGRAL